MVEDEALEADFRCLGLGVAGSAVAGMGSGVGDWEGEVALGIMLGEEMGGGECRWLEESFEGLLVYATSASGWCRRWTSVYCARRAHRM